MPDDDRHTLFARAHRDHQAELGLFGDAASHHEARRIRPRLAADVQEVEARTALTRCALPGEPWSLNPYMGCAHDCVYCYVPDVVHLDRARYGRYVVVKRNLPTVLARELKTKERRSVFMSSATDPYQPAEGVYEVTRRCLERLVRHDWPVRILTRSPLVLRDVDLIRGFTDVKVGMSVPTLDDAARKIIEPGAPPIAGRLDTLRALADAGLRPFVNIAPAYPFTQDIGPREIARTLKRTGVAEVLVGAWRYMDGVRPALRDRVAGSAYDGFPHVVEDRVHYDRMFRALKAAFDREGVPFRIMGLRHEGTHPTGDPPVRAGRPLEAFG